MAKGSRTPKGDYAVGYGKPPKHTRFKPGQSGNRKGRPKGRRNDKTIMREVLERKVTIRENGRTRQVPYLEAFAHRLMERGLSGSTNDQIKLLHAIEKYAPEMLADVPEEPREMIVRFVDSDGNGRPADRALWEDWQWESHRAEVARRNADPEVNAAWKAAGLADEDDEADDGASDSAAA